ncbi:type II toxin-antitoxin system HicA family toxin [uncultured Bacteroides sp.]|uniref:type II toxin-antitoxin system HicA family toxin n=1 Tax=uncultured Bacteroides sp. TaxID=162156 RepID=UPI00261972D3|nr:type II toxin-antitoxin system HicA family toxin [uncultured Bacteroides sp.]
MVKSSEFHRFILIHGRKRGWKWLQGEGNGSHRIYEDKNGIRYPVPYHGSKEIGEKLRKKIIKDMELE